MAATKNTFNLGINRSISKQKFKNENYYDANNIRLTSENNGLSTGAVINIKGNDLAFTIPQTERIYKIKVDTIGILSTLNFYINNALPVSINLTNTTNKASQDIAEEISTFLATQILTNEIKVQYNNTEVYFIGLTNLGITNNIGNPIVLTLVVDVQTNLIPIGYTPIRDSIILFTTNNATSIGGVGQIWKLTYQDTLNTYTYNLELKYNNNCNFSTFYPIRAEGDYENSQMIGIAFTDNFNPLRFFNTEGLNSFAVSPEELDLQSDVFFDIPVLESIDGGGQLLDGMYQYAYRYSNFEGSQTPFSPLSAVINLNKFPESNSYIDYYGSGPGNTARKSITIRIDNIDTRYEQIEIVSLYKSSELGTPLVRSFLTIPVTRGSIFITNTGGEASTILTIEDVLTNGNPFTHCKDITVKDSRLITVNTRNNKFNITDAEFDTRAYRFPARSLFITNQAGLFANATNWLNNNIIDKGVQQTFLTSGPTAWDLDFTSDAINPNQTPYYLDDPTSLIVGTDPVYKFQSDGVTFGGQGKYISYRIKTEDFGGGILADSNVLSTVTSTAGTNFGKGYRDISKNTSQVLSINGKTYPNKSFTNFTSSYLQANIKPYQHEETYRLGIRLWDKKGRKSFDKWIGDITMPSLFELDGYGVLTSFRHIDATSTFKILCLEFTINLPQSVKDKISGYEIVRLERTQNDRTILGSGNLFYSTTFGSNNEVFVTPLSKIDISYLESSISVNTFTMQSPDFKLDSFPGYSVGDELRIAAISKSLRNDTNGGYHFDKPYEPNILYNGTNVRQVIPINNSYTIDNGVNLLGQALTSPTRTFFNRRAGTKISSADPKLEPNSLGNNTVIIDITSIPIDPLVGQNDQDKYYVYYYRNLTNQYGGNTYNNRTSNKYISTNHFRTITNNSSNSNTDTIFGGDIFLSIYDTQKLFRSWLTPTISTPSHSYNYWLAVESYTNPEWRVNEEGLGTPGTINRTGIVPPGDITVNDLNCYETLITNKLYETSNNSKYNFSIPLNFLAIDINDNRIYASELKFSGESINSWSIFKTNSYKDVDSIYGSINCIGNLGNQTIFFQDKAFGVIPINLKTFVKDNSGAQILVSSGEVLSKHEYISSKTGCKHKYGVLYHERGIDFFDINAMKFYRYSDGLKCLSDDGLEQEFANRLKGDIKEFDNAIAFSGISCIYDYKFNESVFTFKDTQQGTTVPFEIKKFTIAYSDMVAGFTSFYSFTPAMYISNKKNIFTPNYDNGKVKDIYIHNIGEFGKFYNTYFPSDITILANPESNLTKTFDNLVLATEVNDSNGLTLQETIDGIQCTNDYQDTTLLPLIVNSDIRRRFRTWTTIIPRDSQNAAYTTLSKPRMTDKYILIKLVYTNNNNKQFILHDIVTDYRTIENVRALIS